MEQNATNDIVSDKVKSFYVWPAEETIEETGENSWNLRELK